MIVVPEVHCCPLCESGCDEVVALRRLTHAQAETIKALIRACNAAAADRAYRAAAFAYANERLENAVHHEGVGHRHG